MTDIFDSTEALDEFKALMSDPAARQAFVELKQAKVESGTRARYAHILKLVAETPWAIRPAMLGVIIDLIAFRMEGGRFTAEELQERIGARRAASPKPKGVAVLPLHGVIVPKASLFSEVSGATSVEGFRAMFREALAADDVSSIVMDVDSPGGMVEGVTELAGEIRAARGRKPIMAVANLEANSAAYWLAAQADEFVVSQSSRLGSIGVYTAHEDRSVADEQKGVKTTLVSAGRFKTEGNPFEPLTEEGREHIQGLVDQFYSMFVHDVAKGRRVGVDEVRSGFGEGRVVSAKDALSLGMADRMGSLEQVIGEQLQAGRQSATAASSVYLGSMTLPVESSYNTGVVTTGIYAGDIQVGPVLAAVDNSEWDGNRAMSECESASDYRSICAGERSTGTPDERQHWALPHHYLGRGPNAAGTRNALARLPQTQGLTNREGAERHLDAHMREINPEREGALDDVGEQIALLRHRPAPRDPLTG
jgi:signal peptide peptidase SppA